MAPTPPADGRSTTRRRWPLVAAVLLLLLAGGVAAAVAMQPDDQPAADPAGHRTKKPTPPTATATETATVTATPSPSPSSSVSPSESGTATPAPADDAAQAVVAYYSMLPDDPQSAWGMLGPDARASAGGYDSYRAFWDSISSLEVGDTSTDGDVVSVDLTYDGSDSETRRLQVAPRGDGWIIAEDLGT